VVHFANPALESAQQKSRIKVTADPALCSFQFNPTGIAKFTTPCEVAKAYLATNGLNYTNAAGAAGSGAEVTVGDKTIKA
jgi:hypothetical protein